MDTQKVVALISWTGLLIFHTVDVADFTWILNTLRPSQCNFLLLVYLEYNLLYIAGLGSKLIVQNFRGLHSGNH